jgi:hypothetical protein
MKRIDIEAITLEFLREDRAWPNLTVLPVKRYSGDPLPLLGLVFFNDKLTVHEANLYDRAEDILASKKWTYPSIDAMVADGWIID